jgi:Cytochrome P450
VVLDIVPYLDRKVTSWPRNSLNRTLTDFLGLPWLGPINQIPYLGIWFKFKEWSDIYGPFYGVKLMGKQHIFIGSEKIASELFGTRGSKYSGRPAVPTIHDSQSKFGTAEYMPLMSKNSLFAPCWKTINGSLLIFQEYHTRQKKFNHIQLAAAQKIDYYKYPSIEAKRFTWRMLNDCSNWVSLCEEMTSRTICRLTWGTPDLAIGLKADAWGLLNAISPVGNLTNLITPLLWIPTFLSPWKKWERNRHRVQQDWFLDNMKGVRKRMAEGTAGTIV